MLIEFSVSNFRSFRERQTFQMTAAPRLGKKVNTFPAGASGEKLPDLLKVAAIYGSNASGKSSFIHALGMIERLATRKPDATTRDIPVRPFRFDRALLDEPSTFEMHFVVHGLRYQFLVGATQNRIMNEALYTYPKGKEALLYSRRHVSGSDEYIFGETFEGGDVLRDAWRRMTGPQSLFISQAVANSSEDLRQLRNPFEWLTEGLFVIDDPAQLSFMGEKVHATENKNLSAGICTFLQQIDVPVTSIHWEPDKDAGTEVAAPKSSEEVDQYSKFKRKGKTTLTHETRLGSADFDISEESSGTRNLIGFWVPSVMLTSSHQGASIRYRVVVVDELDASLHPEAVEHLVQMHLESGAMTQLIFTTHDTHLMSTKLLRRDQLWITDRDSNGATNLMSIHSFKGREGEDVEKRYFEGRYRGLPIRRSK